LSYLLGGWRKGDVADDQVEMSFDDADEPQMLIAKRVFALGWTPKRFEYFDSHVIRYTGRESSKAERIGVSMDRVP
jgi:hypothetical protein